VKFLYNRSLRERAPRGGALAVGAAAPALLHGVLGPGVRVESLLERWVAGGAEAGSPRETGRGEPPSAAAPAEIGRRREASGGEVRAQMEGAGARTVIAPGHSEKKPVTWPLAAAPLAFGEKVRGVARTAKEGAGLEAGRGSASWS